MFGVNAKVEVGFDTEIGITKVIASFSYDDGGHIAVSAAMEYYKQCLNVKAQGNGQITLRGIASTNIFYYILFFTLVSLIQITFHWTC